MQEETMKRVSHIVILLMGFQLLLAPTSNNYAAKRIELRSVDELHFEIVKLLNGEPAKVTASPVLCYPKDQQPPKYVNDLKSWYFGHDTCDALFTPRFSSLNTPLSGSGEIRGFFYDERKYLYLLELLTALGNHKKLQQLPLIQRIELQSTMWELIFGLEYKRSLKGILPPVSPDRADRILKRAHVILKQTLLAPDEISKIPDSLPHLSRLSRVDEIDELITRVISHDASVLEDIHPTQMHAEATAGRFYARIFFAINNKDEYERLQRFLLGSSDIELFQFPSLTTERPAPNRRSPRSETLNKLPSLFGGVRAILILFFNVL